jgi:hypothetical protein
MASGSIKKVHVKTGNNLTVGSRMQAGKEAMNDIKNRRDRRSL